MSEQPGGAVRPSTPTVQQGRRAVPTVQQATPERPGTVPTRQQGEGGVPTREQGSASRTGTDPDGPEFPERLADRYVPLGISGVGIEGAVWRCRAVADGSEVAVKVHFEGRPMDAALLEHLRNPDFHRHVPRIDDFGDVMTPRGPVSWVAMEHLQSTLDQVIGTGLPVDRAKPVLREVAACLTFWQRRVDRNPLDFKPDNLMVRSTDPLQLVLADFGGVAAFTASQQVGGTFMAAPAFTPPEGTWQEKGSPWPWWSLGEIAFLMVTGHLRHRTPGEARSIIRINVLGSLDLAAIPDERWQLLVRGLLTKEPYDRWTTDQVEAWLAGEDPPVADAVGPMADPGPQYSPITFSDGRTFNDPGELAANMLEHWAAAERWLTGSGKQALRDWLEKENLRNRFDVTLLRRLTASGPAVHHAILAFGAAFAPPEVRPRWRAQPVDTDGLRVLLGTAGGATLIRELTEASAFGAIAGYRCGHRSCTGGRCQVIDRLATQLPDTVAGAERMIGAVETGGGPVAVTDQRRAELHEAALSAILAPEDSARLLDLSAIAGPSWWRAVRKNVTAQALGTPARWAAFAAAVVLQQRAREEARERFEVVLQWLRARLAGSGRLVAVALVSFLGMLMVTWLAGVLAHADTAFGSLAQADAMGTAYGLITQLALAPVVLVLAVLSVLMGQPRRRWLLGTWIAAAALGLVADQLPAYTTVGVPQALDDALIWAAGRWIHSIWLGVAIYAVVGFVALRVIFRLAGPDTGVFYRSASPVPVSPVRRLIVFGLAASSLLGAIWAIGTVRLSLFTEFGVPAAAAGRQMALEQSALLLVVLLVAAIAASAWPRSSAMLPIGLLAAAVVGIWGERIPQVDKVRVPTAPEFFTWFAGLWGPGFWGAVLVCLPVTALCVRTAYRLARP